MNIEPLETILKVYKDKQKVFANYFDEETVSKLSGKVYYEEETDDLFLNDNITFVKKNTGKIFHSGKIISIDNPEITIKTSSNYLTLNSNEYYIFIQQRKNKSKKNDRDFYKALLNSL